MQVGEDAPLQVGLNHMAWMMMSLGDLKAMYRRLKEKGVKIDNIMDHGLSIGIYFRDQNGNGLEVSYELPREQWPRQERVFQPDVLGARPFPRTLGRRDGGAEHQVSTSCSTRISASLAT